MQSTFPIGGQGVFVFAQATCSPSCIFSITTADGTDGLKIEFTEGHVYVTELKSLQPLADPANCTGLSTYTGAYYWFSIDAQNQRLYAGMGEARLETVVYSYKFSPANHDEYESVKAFMESLIKINYTGSIQQLRILPDPITLKIPLAVKNTDELTMDDVAAGVYMPKANLSPICQKLYDCIAGERFILDGPDFPDFTQAIEYSIRTPGCWCYKKLVEKSREFNPDKPFPYETYLRITLGENNGESPGIPYVMEIWPVGHYSPVHSHANASAIIRVLNGEINVKLFPFLCAEKDGVAPFGTATFKKGDVAWISPTLNQVHQLKNMESNTYTCITIQCYMYNENDRRHYDYFDYLGEEGKKHTYEPDSDMDFLEFKQRMRTEWAAAQLARAAAAAPAPAPTPAWPTVEVVSPPKWKFFCC